MEQKEPMYRYWGKARSKSIDGAQWHLLVYHSLDVAAVGKILLERHERLRRDIAKSLGLNEETFLAWMVFFLALHDLGKFAEWLITGVGGRKVGSDVLKMITILQGATHVGIRRINR